MMSREQGVVFQELQIRCRKSDSEIIAIFGFQVLSNAFD